MKRLKSSGDMSFDKTEPSQQRQGREELRGNGRSGKGESGKRRDNAEEEEEDSEESAAAVGQEKKRESRKSSHDACFAAHSNAH